MEKLRRCMCVRMCICVFVFIFCSCPEFALALLLWLAAAMPLLRQCFLNLRLTSWSCLCIPHSSSPSLVLPVCSPFLFPCHCLLPHRCSSGKVDDCLNFLGAATEEGGSSAGKKMIG